MPKTKASRAPTGAFRQPQTVPPVVWDDETNTALAGEMAGIAVMRNGFVIHFIRKQQIGTTTRLFTSTGFLDLSITDIASFEKDVISPPRPIRATQGREAQNGHAPREPVDPRPAAYNSMPTGTRIQEDINTNGKGKLAVENGTSEDAVVRLSDSGTGQTVRWFFVQAHSSANIEQIPQGSYRLTYTTGLNWIEASDTFSWNPTYNEFERSVDFSEERDSEGVKYDAISVTLNPVPFGNVRTKGVTRDKFMNGHHHVALQR